MICDFVGDTGPSELENIKSVIIDLARVGFHALSIRPLDSSPIPPDGELAAFITLVHRAGLKIIIRVPQHFNVSDLDQHFDDLLTWVASAVDVGADGIDLNAFDGEHSPAALNDKSRQQLTTFVHTLQAELSSYEPVPILAGESEHGEIDDLRYHLEEKWFHHLRDNALVSAPWDASALREHVNTTLSLRDSLGHVAAWHWSHFREVSALSDVFDPSKTPSGSWAEGASDARRTAMVLFCLSLPGALYMPYAHMAGRLIHSAGQWRRIWDGDKTSAGEAQTLRLVLRTREERAMGVGSLAWVDSLEWAHSGVSVHMSAGVMVVLNTSDAPVEVPAEHRLLVSSHGALPQSRTPTVIPPEACGWFETARIQPPTTRYDD